MQGNIIPFETHEEKFLREASELLDKLSTEDTPLELRAEYLTTLDELVESYEDFLPEKYDELFNLITLLVSEDNIESVHESPFLEEALILRDIITREPDADLFISLAFNDFEYVCSQFEFEEETIASIVDFLEFAKQGINALNPDVEICLFEIPGNINPVFKKYNFTSKQIFKLLVSLANMPLSDDLMKRIINLTDVLPPNHFMVFCSNILLYYCEDDEILNALIDITEKINYPSFPNNYLKNQVYCNILACSTISENIIAKIIKCVHLKIQDYYELFCSLLKEYPKSKIMRNAMLERLENDRTTTSENMMPYLNRLWMRAKNT